MVNRKKTILCLIPVAAGLVGCGSPQASRFQNSFLPRAPRVEWSVPADPPQFSTSNPYLAEALPRMIPVVQISPHRLRADLKLQDADQHFQSGKRSYQAGAMEDARKEFDAAVDSIFEAVEQDPANQQDYNRRLEEMVDSIHRFDMAGMGAAAGTGEAQFEKAPLEDILEMTFPVDPKLKDRVREQVAATTSQLPLSVTDAVLGYINFFSSHGHRTIVAATRRSGRYRPMIQRILDEEGVPQELIHLAQAESGFMPRAMSSAAAGGMWQFLASRGQEYGLMRTSLFDDRMDPEKATRAAARHLRDLYTEFGDWYLAIAAYNCGPMNVERAVERTGYADFWELRRRGALPAETTSYVPIILAMTIMEKNAAEYGLEGLELDPALEYDTIDMTALTSMTLVSDILDLPTSELSAMNPSLLRGVVPERYALHVPKGSGKPLLAALEKVPASSRDSWRMHTLGAGETVDTVAKRFGAPVATVLAVNTLQTAGDAREGDRLLIPATARTYLTAAASKHGTSSRGRTAVAAKHSKTVTTTADHAKASPSSSRSKGKVTTTARASKKASTTRSASVRTKSQAKKHVASTSGSGTSNPRHKAAAVTQAAVR